MARVRPNFPERYAEYLRSYPRLEPERRYLDATLGELHFDLGMSGDKIVCYRMDIIKRYPFPAIKHTAFIPEGQVLLRLPGKFRCVNEVLKTYYRDNPDNVSGSKWRKAWRGMVFYYLWLLTHKPRYFWLSLSRKFSSGIK